MHSLPIFVRLRGDPVLVLGEGEAAEAKRRLVERAGGFVTGPGEPSLPRIAFIAHEDPEQARQAADYCRRRGMLVNVVDRPDLCDFTTPAIVDRDPVLIAVSTGGASAGLAKQLRLRLEALLPPQLGALASALNAARDQLRERFSNARERRQAIDAVLAPGAPLDPMREVDPATVAAWLASDSLPTGGGGQVEITLTSSDPDELTLRTARLLGQADTVVHDENVPPAILARARADAALVLAGGSMPTPDSGLTVVLHFRDDIADC